MREDVKRKGRKLNISVPRLTRPQVESVSSRDSGVPLPAMPSPEVYDAEYQYWPWGQLIRRAAEWVEKNAPHGAVVFDYMCGTGYLLANIQQVRADLRLSGCDINKSFVDFARRKYAGIEIRCADARDFRLNNGPSIIMCTAGLHHLTFDQQEAFLNKLFDECGKDTSLLIGEEVLGEYYDEKTRRVAALRLSYALIEYGIQHDWPIEQIDAACDVLRNDVLLRGEYKRSATQWKSLLQQRFSISKSRWLWRDPGGGGDIIFICHKRGAGKRRG